LYVTRSDVYKALNICKVIWVITLLAWQSVRQVSEGLQSRNEPGLETGCFYGHVVFQSLRFKGSH